MERYYKIPQYPETTSGTTILVRLLDGLGFRFRWSTEGLRNNDYNFRPASDCMSIKELIQHIWGLINWVGISMGHIEFKRKEDPLLIRKSVLEMIYALRESLISLNDEELSGVTINGKPFWHIINGPLADALTHVGQINSFRRIAGNPTPKARVFLGAPPKG